MYESQTQITKGIGKPREREKKNIREIIKNDLEISELEKDVIFYITL